MRDGSRLSVVVVLLLVVTVGGIPTAAGVVHEDAPRNQTVVPVAEEDHYPGNDEASYMRFAAPNNDPMFESLKYLEFSVSEWQAGVIGNCGPEDIEVAGIDRGNDDPGTEVDEQIADNVQNSYQSPHRTVIEFTTPDDPFGSPVNFEAEDQFVGHQKNCYGNPDEPGWYRLFAKINGTTYDDEHVEFPGHSHYFYICECSSYDEAVDRLGPPPSRESRATPTPAATATPTATPVSTPTSEPTPTRTPPQGTPFPSPTPSPTPTATPEPTATATAASTATVERTPTPSETAAAWARNTPAAGPGFGAGGTLVALLAIVMGLRRR